MLTATRLTPSSLQAGKHAWFTALDGANPSLLLIKLSNVQTQDVHVHQVQPL